MLSIKLTYLDEYRVGEHDTQWPADAVRLISALVATAHTPAGPDTKEQREVIDQLIQAGDPDLSYGEAPSSEQQSWVPDARTLNDQKFKTAQYQAHWSPMRQAVRSTVYPDPGSVYYTWPDLLLDGPATETLDTLLQRVSYVGKAGSFCVAIRSNDPPVATLVPDPDCPQGLRAMRQMIPDWLERLDRSHERQLQPPPVMIQYVAPHQRQHSVYTEMLTLHATGYRAYGVESEIWCNELRRAFLKASDGIDLSPVLSGHEPDGNPRRGRHIAWVPLIDMGYPYSHGHIMGFGVLLPDLAPEDRVQLIVALYKVTELTAHGNTMKVDIAHNHTAWTLNPERWSHPSAVWQSATPVIWARHPRGRGEKYIRSVFKAVGVMCDYAGLPMPVKIDLNRQVEGTASPKQYVARLKTGSYISHLRLTFACPLNGPVALGRGQHSGMGLFAPREGRA